MPTKGNPRHAFRFEPGLWHAFNEAVHSDPKGRNMAEVVRDLVAWYSREPKAPKPERPDRMPPAT